MATLSNAITTLDPTPDRTTALTELLNSLSALAQARNELNRITMIESIRTAGGENLTVPVTNILSDHSETRAYVESDPTVIVNELVNGVQSLFSSNDNAVSQGVGKLLTSMMIATLGGGTAEERSFQTYFIVINGLAINRVDISMYNRDVQVTGITKQIQNIFSITSIISSVNVNKISFNAFLSVYNFQLSRLNLEEEEIIKRIKAARHVFSLLRDPMENQESFGNTHRSFVYPSECMDLPIKNFNQKK